MKRKSNLAEFADSNFATRPTEKEIIRSGYYSKRGCVEDTRSDIQRLRQLEESPPPSATDLLRRFDNPTEATRRRIFGLYSKLRDKL